MFSLRTAKGRLALLAVVLLSFTMIACDADSPTAPEADQAEENNNNEETLQENEDGDSSEADPEVEEEEGEEEAAPATSAAVTSIDYRSCHTRQSAGGNSDGVFVLGTDLPVGSQVEVDVIVKDGTETVPIAGEVDEDGLIIVVAPLTNFGEGIELFAVRGPDGEAIPIDASPTNFVVEETSDCSTHPEDDDN